MELHGPQAPTEGRLGLLGAAIAGTVTAGIDAAAPTWVALILGVAAPVLVGFLFPGERTWPLTAGLLLAPLLAAVARGGPWWLVVLTLPVVAGFTFVLVRVGQRWRDPVRPADPEAHATEVRVTAEVAAGWQQRCIRGVRRKGSSATIEILPKGCGGNG